jgi:hypothetical protein
MFKDARLDVFMVDITNDVTKLLAKHCLAAEAMSRLEIPLSKLRAAVYAASIVLIVNDSAQDFYNLRKQLMDHVGKLAKRVFDFRDSPELAGPLNLFTEAVSEALDAIIFGLVDATTQVTRQQHR